MTDIVERLQQPVMLHSNPEQSNAERREAASEIERLRDTVRAIASDCEHMVKILEGRAEQDWNYKYQHVRIALARSICEQQDT